MRRILCAGLCLCMLLCLCGCDGTPSSGPDTTDPAPPITLTVEVGMLEAAVGETVSVPVTVSANSSLVHADILLRYDPACLRPVQQYDATGDVYTLAKAEAWPDAIYSAQTANDTVRVMLASGLDGMTAQGTLFAVAFEVLAFSDGQTAVTAEITACGIHENGEDVDAIAENRLTVHPGKIKKK